MKCNQSRPGFELVSPCPFPTTIAITPRAPSAIAKITPLLSFYNDGVGNHRRLIWNETKKPKHAFIFITIIKNFSYHWYCWPYRYLSDTPLYKNKAQGHFIVEPHTGRNPCGKNCWFSRQSPNESPLAPSNKLSPAKPVKSWRDSPTEAKDYRSQLPSTNTRPPRSRPTN